MKKICDGVYEFDEWPDEEFDGTLSDLSRECMACARDLGAVEIVTNNLTWRSVRESTAQHWHTDSGLGDRNYMMTMALSPDPTLGTEVKLPDGGVFHCKTWTPYLLRADVPHRGPQAWTDSPRALVRCAFVLPEEAEARLAA